ncbi:MAG: hypothetical protein ACYCSX_01780 [Acidimicrobiales bacterium]
MPVVSDAFDAAALVEAVVAFATDLVMHQLTDLPDHLDRVPDDAPHCNRIRTEGTRNLLAGTAAAGARRFLAQGIAWTPPGSGTANADHERLALDAGGVVVLLVEDDEDPRSTRHEARGTRHEARGSRHEAVGTREPEPSRLSRRAGRCPLVR